MDNWPWSILNRYCEDPTQKAWVSNQLQISPIPNGTSPEDWLLARSMVAEGMTESQAWSETAAIRQSHGQQSSNNNHGNGNDVFTQQTTLTFQGNAQPNGFYNDHTPSVFDQPRQPQPPYGFVSLQQVAPQNSNVQPRSLNSVPVFTPNQPQIPTQGLPPQFANLTQQQLQQLQIQYQRQRQNAQANAIAGPSISPHLLHQPTRLQQTQPALHGGQNQAQPRQNLTIDLTGSDSPPESQIDPELRNGHEISDLSRTNSPIRLIPPGSARTPSPSAFYELTVQPGPSRKRSLVPIPQHDNPKSAKKTKSNSSSIDPPLKYENNQLLPSDEKRKPTPPPASAAAATAAPASAPAPVAEDISMKDIRPHLTPEALKLPKPVNLFKNLRKREKKDAILPPLFQPTPKEVLEIVTAIRDHASQEYLTKMADDDRYCDVFASWLAKTLKDIEKWESTIVPILQVLAKTDMPMENVEDTRIQIRAKKVADLAIKQNLASKEAIQSAFQRYDTYVVNVLIPKYGKSERDDKDDKPDNKKRKIEDDIKPKTESGQSKPSSSKISAPTSSINGSKAPIKPSSSTTGSAKPNGRGAADMSFFGSNPSSSSVKPKTKLPDIKRKPSQTPGSGVPSINSNLLQSTFQRLNATSSSTTNTNTVNVNANASNLVNQLVNEIKKEDSKPRYNSKGKLIRNVRFKDNVKSEDGGGALEQVKEFRQEAKEFEKFDWEHDDDIHGQSAHQMDMDEGAALASARGHATIEWYEPTPYVDPSEPIETEESKAQADRERGILAKFHPPGIPIPDPSEDQVRVVEHDSQTRIMDPMNSIGEIIKYQSRGHYNAPTSNSGGILPHQQGNSVSDLLKGLQNVIPPPQPQQSHHDPYNSGNPYSYDSYNHQNQHQQPHPQSNWGQPWASNQNGYNNNRGYDNYHNARELRPVDRDPGVPICRFWSRGDCSHGDRCKHRHV